MYYLDKCIKREKIMSSVTASSTNRDHLLKLVTVYEKLDSDVQTLELTNKPITQELIDSYKNILIGENGAINLSNRTFSLITTKVEVHDLIRGVYAQLGTFYKEMKKINESSKSYNYAFIQTHKIIKLLSNQNQNHAIHDAYASIYSQELAQLDKKLNVSEESIHQPKKNVKKRKGGIQGGAAAKKRGAAAAQKRGGAVAQKRGAAAAQKRGGAAVQKISKQKTAEVKPLSPEVSEMLGKFNPRFPKMLKEFGLELFSGNISEGQVKTFLKERSLQKKKRLNPQDLNSKTIKPEVFLGPQDGTCGLPSSPQEMRVDSTLGSPETYLSTHNIKKILTDTSSITAILAPIQKLKKKIKKTMRTKKWTLQTYLKEINKIDSRDSKAVFDMSAEEIEKTKNILKHTPFYNSLEKSTANKQVEIKKELSVGKFLNASCLLVSNSNINPVGEESTTMKGLFLTRSVVPNTILGVYSGNIISKPDSIESVYEFYLADGTTIIRPNVSIINDFSDRGDQNDLRKRLEASTLNFTDSGNPSLLVYINSHVNAPKEANCKFLQAVTNQGINVVVCVSTKQIDATQDKPEELYVSYGIEYDLFLENQILNKGVCYVGTSTTVNLMKK
tara:strand:- start:155 stop:2002 length:1848 start_codon:yes stop_codon:yes gene_type:complete